MSPKYDNEKGMTLRMKVLYPVHRSASAKPPLLGYSVDRRSHLFPTPPSQGSAYFRHCDYCDRFTEEPTLHMSKPVTRVQSDTECVL